MDKEILEILKSLKADVNGLKADMTDMKADMTDMKADMTDMKADMTDMKADMTDMKADMKDMNIKIDKNSVMLEDVNRKVETIAEVQISFSESLQREKEREDKELMNRLDLIEGAVIETSKIVKDIQKDLSLVELVTANNWADIVKLKAVK